MQKEGGVPKRRLSKRLSGDNPEENRGAAKEIAHTTKLERDREEKAVARSLRPDEKRVLRRQAREAREQRNWSNAAWHWAREEF